MNMRRKKRMLLTAGLPVVAIAIFLMWPTCDGEAANQQVECDSRAKNIKAITAPGLRTTAVSLTANPGLFDPLPLLSTKITVGGRRPSCLLAGFSAMALPQDNWVVFQVKVDGVPMRGHAAGLGGVTEPVVFDPDEGGANGVFRMVAYNFFTVVQPGEHTVEVMYAGCCSSEPFGSGAAVESPVLKLEYTGE
jgi:hypothetical protein